MTSKYEDPRIATTIEKASAVLNSRLNRRSFLMVSGGVIGAGLLAACDTDDDDDDVAPPPADTDDDDEEEPVVDTDDDVDDEEEEEPVVEDDDDEEEPDAPSAQVDQLVIAMGDDTAVFDPDLFQTTRATAMYRLVWGTPMKMDPARNYLPDLAETWEYVDDTTIEMQVREGVTWADGEPLTADDFVYTWERITDENRESLNIPRFSAWLEDVEAVDEMTVRFTTFEVYAPGLETISSHFYVYPRHHLEGITDREYEEDPLGTGPYRLVSREYNQQSTFEPVENWWGGEQPFARIQVVIIPEPFPRTTALLTGEVDIVQDPPLPMHDDVENAEGFHLVRTDGSWGVQFYQFPHAGNRPPNTDEIDVKEVRQALNWALDVETIAEAVGQGMVTPVPGPWAPNHWAYPDDAWDQAYGYDPDRARELLAEGGYPDGFTLHFLTTQGFSALDRELSEASVPYFEDIGLDVEFTVLERAAYSQVRDEGGSSLYYLGLSGGGGDPDNVTSLYMTSQGRDRAFMDTDPELEEVIWRGVEIVDTEERTAYYQNEVFPAVLDSAPWVFLWSLSHALGVRDGIHIEPEWAETGWIDIMELEVTS